MKKAHDCIHNVNGWCDRFHINIDKVNPDCRGVMLWQKKTTAKVNQK